MHIDPGDFTPEALAKIARMTCPHPHPSTERGKQWLRDGAPVGEDYRIWHEAQEKVG